MRGRRVTDASVGCKVEFRGQVQREVKEKGREKGLVHKCKWRLVDLRLSSAQDFVALEGRER